MSAKRKPKEKSTLIPGTQIPHVGELEWRAGTCSDLSGSWIEVTNFLDYRKLGMQRTEIVVQRTYSSDGPEDGQYMTWVEVDHGGPAEVTLKGPPCETVQEAMLLVEDLLLALVAQGLAERYDIAIEAVMP